MYQGEPIAAVAAIDELTATEAIEKIKVEYEPLPWVVDPIVTLRPGGPNARAEGNVWRPPQVAEFKLPESAVAELNEGRIPMLAETPVPAWEIGSVEEALKKADLIVDETVVHQSTGHQAMEPRSAMAYWQNGKLFLHGSTQSVARTRATVAQWVGFKPEEEDKVVLISEYTGGGFGGKIPGAHSMAIPALLSKKAGGRPVLMRVSREEENYIGRARPGIHLRARIGFRKDGRILAMDLCAIADCGPYANQGDAGTLASTATSLYNPETIRYRGISVLTNTPPRVAQRAPGGEQASAMLEPLISKGARQLGVDQVEIRKINAPSTGSQFGPPPPAAAVAAAKAKGAAPPSRTFFTSCHLREALDMGATLFNWEERKKRNGQRVGSKVIGVGVGLGTYTAGSINMDGLLLIRPDGKVYVQHGCRESRYRLRPRYRAHRRRGARHAMGAF